MGLFDAFKRKPKPAEGDRAPVAASEDHLGELERGAGPREQHYIFAHIAFRQLAFRDPQACMAVLYSPVAKKMLAEIWDDVTKYCAQSGHATDLKADELKIHQGRVGLYPCVVVEMPPPLRMTEAHYVALILRGHLENGKVVNEDPPLLYYTLEFSLRGDGTPFNMLCAWDDQGAHHNYGEGPPADVQAFLDALAKLDPS